MFLKNCVVTNNSVYGDGGVGYLEEHSKINITTSIFRKNSARGSGGVFRIRNSTAIVWNSFFVGNSAGTNGGVIYAEYFSRINISQTICYGNKASKSGVLYARAANVFVNDSIIQQNSAHRCGAIAVDTNSVLEVSFCQVNRNKGGAFSASNNSLFISKSSIFNANTDDIGKTFRTIYRFGTSYVSIVLDNSTGYLENCTFLVGDVSFSKSELRLSHTVFLQNMVQKVIEISSYNFMHHFINRLYTYKNLMRHGNKILRSNATDFKQIAIKEYFIIKINNLPFQSKLAAKETQFASSKFSVPRFFSFCMQPFHITFNLFNLLNFSIYHRFEGLIVSSLSLLQLKVITVLSQFYPNHVSTTAPVTVHPGIEPTYSTVETKA